MSAVGPSMLNRGMGGTSGADPNDPTAGMTNAEAVAFYRERREIRAELSKHPEFMSDQLSPEDRTLICNKLALMEKDDHSATFGEKTINLAGWSTILENMNGMTPENRTRHFDLLAHGLPAMQGGAVPTGGASSINPLLLLGEPGAAGGEGSTPRNLGQSYAAMNGVSAQRAAVIPGHADCEQAAVPEGAPSAIPAFRLSGTGRA